KRVNYKKEEEQQDDEEEDDDDETSYSEREGKSRKKDKEKEKKKQKDREKEKYKEKEKQKEKQRKKEKMKEKEKIKDKERKKEKQKDKNKEKEKEKMKEELKEEKKEEQIDVSNKQQVDIINKQQQTQQQQLEVVKKDEKVEIIPKDMKMRLNSFSAPKIRTEIQVADFRGIISRTGAVMPSKRPGGIAIVDLNEEIPSEMSYDEMINIKGVLFTVPDFALYMNGQQIWKRNINAIAQQTQQQTQQSSSSSQSSTSQILPQSVNLTQPLPVWAHLCLQIDMESEERIAKFFIGPDLGELVGVGISGVPNEIKAVV
ncbi:MAG: hypothetical protein EZS28_042276, partial [Streblomastix strix]